MLVIALIASFSALSTYTLCKKYQKSPVLNSACLSFLFAATTVWMFNPMFSKFLNQVFLGGSFVGMTHHSVIKNRKSILFAALIFAGIYVVLKDIKGFGGVLGFKALLSVCVSWLILTLGKQILTYLSRF